MRRSLVFGLIVLPMLCVLMGLGTWQLYRLNWKQGVLEAIAHAEAQAPVQLTDTVVPFSRVRVAGCFRVATVAALGAELRGAQPGVRLLGILDRADAQPVLVDLGFVPLTPQADAAALISYLPAGAVDLMAYVRPADTPGYFAAADDTARRRFYTFDPVRIGATLGVADIAPFALVRLGEDDTYPIAARHLPQPANNHLSYALTWYGLAITLLVVFVLWARRRQEPS